MPLIYTLVSLPAASQLPTTGAIGAGISHPASDHVFMNGQFVMALSGAAQLTVGESWANPFQGCQLNATAGHAGCYSVQFGSSPSLLLAKKIQSKNYTSQSVWYRYRKFRYRPVPVSNPKIPKEAY
jgi:hypothetical protein